MTEIGETYKAGAGETIDIILPTHGKLELLTRPCIQALYTNTRTSFHLIVVDDSTPDMDGGTDKTPEFFKRLAIEQANITYIHWEQPFKNGNEFLNVAMTHSRCRFVATVTNSVRVEPDWDIVPVQMLANSPKVGIVGMKSLMGDTGKIESAGIWMSGTTPCDMGRDFPRHLLLGSYPVFSLQWAFALLRKEAVMGNLGEFWEGHAGWDDIDNTLYLRYKGWEAWYCGMGIGIHFPHATRGSSADKVLIKNRKNAEMFYKRWGLWDEFKQFNPYAPEYFPEAKMFLCNIKELPLTVEPP